MSDDEQREWQRLRERASQDKLTMLVAGLLLVVVGGGGMAGWLFWGYLQTGTWSEMTPRTLFGWSFVSDMIGLQNIANWLLDRWIGWYPLTLGVLVFWAGVQEE